MINRGSLGPSHGDSRASTPRLAVIVIAAALSGLVATRAHAQSDPPSQDDQLRSQLGLGDNKGCFNLLGLPNTDTTPVDQTLRNLGPQIGNELRAICGSSQVNSASSQGGALNTLQATKTVAQFRLVRRRIDQRLQPGRGAKPTRELLFGFPQQAPSPSTTLGRELAGGIGLFGELEFEQRDRVNTVYESGYESDRNGFSVGVDYLAGKGVVGAWIGRSHQDADLTGSGVLIASPFPNSTEDAAFRELVDDPEVLAAVCGGSPEPGTFEQDATRVGGFAGWGVGGAGFIDGTISYTRRSHDYSRGLCAIENQGSPAFLADVIFTDLNNNGTRDAGELQPAIGRGILFSDDGDGVLEQFESVFDDIFAGTLSGSTDIREISFSFRGGADLAAGNWNIGPRAVLTYTNAETDTYVETGSRSCEQFGALERRHCRPAHTGRANRPRARIRRAVAPVDSVRDRCRGRVSRRHAVWRHHPPLQRLLAP